MRFALVLSTDLVNARPSEACAPLRWNVTADVLSVKAQSAVNHHSTHRLSPGAHMTEEFLAALNVWNMRLWHDLRRREEPHSASARAATSPRTESMLSLEAS